MEAQSAEKASTQADSFSGERENLVSTAATTNVLVAQRGSVRGGTGADILMLRKDDLHINMFWKFYKLFFKSFTFALRMSEMSQILRHILNWYMVVPIA